MIQSVFYGPAKPLTSKALDIRWNEKAILVVIVILILAAGIFPKPVLDLTKETVETILAKMNYKY